MSKDREAAEAEYQEIQRRWVAGEITTDQAMHLGKKVEAKLNRKPFAFWFGLVCLIVFIGLIGLKIWA